MIKQPDRPLGPDFDKARDWVAQQERQLTDRQRKDYDKLKQQQNQQRLEQQQKLDRARRELENTRKRKQAKPELALNPPGIVPDRTTNRLARDALAAQNGLASLDRRQADERIKKLKEFEQQRAQDRKTGQKLESSWERAVGKAARQEADRGLEQSRNLTKQFDRSR